MKLLAYENIFKRQGWENSCTSVSISNKNAFTKCTIMYSFSTVKQNKQNVISLLGNDVLILMGTPEPCLNVFCLISSPQGRALLLPCSALFSCALLVCVLRELRWFVWPYWSGVPHVQYSEGVLVHAVEGERDHKVWSLTSIVHTHIHTPLPHPLTADA